MHETNVPVLHCTRLKSVAHNYLNTSYCMQILFLTNTGKKARELDSNPNANPNPNANLTLNQTLFLTLTLTLTYVTLHQTLFLTLTSKIKAKR